MGLSSLSASKFKGSKSKGARTRAKPSSEGLDKQKLIRDYLHTQSEVKPGTMGSPQGVGQWSQKSEQQIQK